MATPHLDIAKVSFAALMLRPDPTSQSRAEIDDFLRLLDTTISRCSPTNVQKCKQWIIANIAHSSARTAAVLKYLTALSKSLTRPLRESRQAREPSSRRKRLHILYVLNDALYHTCARSRCDSFAKHIEPGLPDLLQLAASYAHCPKHAKKINKLLEIWKTEGYFGTALHDKLLAIVHDAPKNAIDEGESTGKSLDGVITASKSAKNVPFLMPAMHGDATAAWYDLPAANWLPVMEPNSTRPMNPEMIKPLQFKSGPAEAHLVDAVKSLLADADRLYAREHAIGEDDGIELDQMGQPIVRDEITGEIIGGQTYYGWSREFCKKMKLRRAKGNRPQNGGHSQDRGGSRSRSRSSSRSSSSQSRSRSPQRSKRRRMSGSYSRSRSPSRSRTRSRRRGRSYTRSRSQSLSHSGAGNSRYSRSHDSRSRSPYRARSGERYPRNGQESVDTKAQHLAPPRGPANHQLQASFQQPPVPPAPFPMGGDFSNNNFPGFPPRPPNYNGPWPPPIPPPPMPPQGPGMGFAQGGWMPNMMPVWNGAVPPPPLPPPPQAPQSFNQGQFQDQYTNTQYGRGGQGSHRGNSQRGGWGRGRGW